MGSTPDTSTEVLEGASGFSDVYSVALTVKPADNETVTVTLSSDDPRVTASSKSTGLAHLTFTAADWDKPQLVVVSATDDSVVEGTELATITHQITSTGGKYSAFPSTAYPKLTVTVYDDETPGLVVQETGGSTVVVDDGTTDTYRVRLTSAPAQGSDVTLTMRTDMQTLLSGPGVIQIVDQSGTKPYFEYTFTFTTANWYKWAVITVGANPAFVATNSGFKTFPPQDQNLNQIRGPLIIEGGIGPEVDRSLRAPVLLPNEIDSPSAQVGNSPTSESSDIDTLNIFNTDTTVTDAGRLSYRKTDAAGHFISNPGLALTGFRMGGDLTANQGTTANPDFLYFGGGITYNGLEIVDILLGKGNDTLRIDDTGDRDEKAGASPDPATITVVQGGGGDDTIIANNRGHGPLVIYGDTSEDGVSYSNDQPAASVNGTKFNNPGNDTINASAMPAHNDGFVGVVIYGGPGNDTIYGSQGNDQLAGGSGDDTIYAGAGNDDVYGDFGVQREPPALRAGPDCAVRCQRRRRPRQDQCDVHGADDADTGSRPSIWRRRSGCHLRRPRHHHPGERHAADRDDRRDRADRDHAAGCRRRRHDPGQRRRRPDLRRLRAGRGPSRRRERHRARR